VWDTVMVNFLSRLIFVAMILSLVSLVLMALYHLILISFSLWWHVWITLSHQSTQIRCADLEMRIWRRWVAPFRFGFPLFWCGSFSWHWGIVTEPQPKMMPRLICGQESGVCGHVV
jgi:hypothetical protein